MSTRTSARSQRAFPASQSRSKAPRGTQPGPSQSQRVTRRAARIQEEDEDEDGDDDDDSGHAEPSQNGVEDPDADLLADGNVDTVSRFCRSFISKLLSWIFGQDTKRRAAELVRLALFTEHKRVPLKRDDITKKGTFRFRSKPRGCSWLTLCCLCQCWALTPEPLPGSLTVPKISFKRPLEWSSRSFLLVQDWTLTQMKLMMNLTKHARRPV